MANKTRVVNRRKAQFDVYIGRPSPWGNPFSHMPDTLAQFRVANREEAISRFREWFLAQPELVARAKRELKGKVLGCWCKPYSCHGDVIAEIVDGHIGSPVDINPLDCQGVLWDSGKGKVSL